ncbi:MAG: FHA domain-containing protein [Nitrospirota bacterium]
MIKLVERKEGGQQGFSAAVGDRLSVGRSADNGLHLDDRSVSSHHAEILVEGGRPVIHDRGSTNGVWVNGERVQSREIQVGDVVKIGVYEMIVLEDRPETAVEKTILMGPGEAEAVPAGAMGAAAEGERTLSGESTSPEIKAVPSGDATMFVGEAPLPPPFGRLVCLDGSEAGKEHVLGEGAATVGRGEDSLIRVNDESISRHHAEIARDAAGVYTLVDKGSRNGTFVGGTRVDSLVLKGGEEIVFGTVRFRFIAPGEIFARTGPEPAGKAAVPPPPAKPSAPGKKKGMILVGGIGGGVLLLLLLLLLLGPSKPPSKPPAGPAQKQAKAPPAGAPAQPGPGPTAQGEDSKQKMRDLYQQGIQAAKERKWDEALKLYDQALALDPAFPLAKAARAEAERDRQVHIKMAEVNQLLGQQKFEEAVTLAQALPPSSTFDKEIVLLRKRVKDEMIKTSLSKAEAHIKEKKFQEARQAIEAAETADPSSESVKRLKADLASAETEQKRAAIRVKKVADDQAGARRGRWMDAYMKGYLAEAAEHLRRGGDEKTAAKADQVKSSYERGLAAYQEGRLAQAYGEWDRTLQIDREITRGGKQRSFVSKEIGRIMAKEYLSRAKSAVDQKEYETASKNWQKALAVDPGNPEAEAGLGKLKGIAQKLYEEGYVLESVNLPAALAKWRQVISIVPASDPNHRKAAEKLRKHEGNQG